jgi:hypothetical protein
MTLGPVCSLELGTPNKDSENQVQSISLIHRKVVVEALAERLGIVQHAKHGSRKEQCNRI